MSVSRITSIHLPEPIGRIDEFPSSGGTSWAVDLALAGPTVYATSHEELRAWVLDLLAAVDAAAPVAPATSSTVSRIDPNAPAIQNDTPMVVDLMQELADSVAAAKEARRVNPTNPDAA